MCHHPLQACDSELGKSTATGLFPWKYLEKGMCTQESFWDVLPMLTVGKTWKQDWQKWLSHKGIQWSLRKRATSSIPFVLPQLQRPWSLFSQWTSHVKHHLGRAILEGAPVGCSSCYWSRTAGVRVLWSWESWVQMLEGYIAINIIWILSYRRCVNNWLW